MRKTSVGLILLVVPLLACAGPQPRSAPAPIEDWNPPTEEERVRSEIRVNVERQTRVLLRYNELCGTETAAGTKTCGAIEGELAEIDVAIADLQERLARLRKGAEG